MSMPRWPTSRTPRVEKLAGVARSRLRGGIGRLDRAALTEVERALLLVLGFA